MPKFEVVSPYQPSGDQPEAIDALAEGIENGLKEQVLLGVTESHHHLVCTSCGKVRAVKAPELA